MTISKRAMVRILSFCIAVIAVLAAYAIIHYNNGVQVKRQLEYSYLRAVEDLSSSLDNIKTTLNKGIYAYSPEMLTMLSAKLWSDAATAKVSLSQLPINELNLESVNKFLSQAGNYSKSISKRYSDGEQLSNDDMNNMETLYDYAKQLSDRMWDVEQKLQSGYITFEKASEIAGQMGSEQQTATVTEGFADFEEGYDNYPTLIYDGPFSDHIMEKQPIMLKNKPEISEQDALDKAKRYSGVSGLSYTHDEAGKMPSYIFEADGVTVGITKAGGYFSYMLKSSPVGEITLSSEDAIRKAQEYLTSLGIKNMTKTYYEKTNNVCIINFAGVQNNVTLYTDLIKIGVALDDGEIQSFDARGYLTNHTERPLGKPTLSKEEASQKVSTLLTQKDSKLCIIPSDGLRERYCYEFLCTDKSGQQILVYINAENGKEEQILLLKISENGILTV